MLSVDLVLMEYLPDLMSGTRSFRRATSRLAVSTHLNPNCSDNVATRLLRKNHHFRQATGNWDDALRENVVAPIRSG